MADLMEQADEVQEALGRTYNTPEVDDDELAAELDALGDEVLDDDQSYLDDLPEAPTTTKPEAEKEKKKVCTYELLAVVRLNVVFSGWNSSG